MLRDILFAFWFLLPAGAANVTPILVTKLPLIKHWTAPIDGGRKFRGVEIFGAHKTWRGLLSGMAVAVLVLWLQQVLVAHTGWGAYVGHKLDYASLPTVATGLAFGFGALGGDAIESFFKRQKGIKSGHAWIPFDQVDYIVGAIIASLPFVVLRPIFYIYMLVIWFGMHLVSSYAGYKTGFKERPI